MPEIAAVAEVVVHKRADAPLRRTAVSRSRPTRPPSAAMMSRVDSL